MNNDTGDPKDDDSILGGSSGSSGKSKSDFNIPYGMEDKYPDLIELIIQTDSMNDEERQYWFSIMPVMTKEQVARLQEILEEEKRKLAELDEKYEKELQKIAEKHFLQKTTQERQKNWHKIQSQKEKYVQEDEDAIDDVLSELEDI